MLFGAKVHANTPREHVTQNSGRSPGKISNIKPKNPTDEPVLSKGIEKKRRLPLRRARYFVRLRHPKFEQVALLAMSECQLGQDLDR